MSIEDDKRIVREFVAAIQTGDRDRIAALLAPDFVWIHPLDPDSSPLAGTYDRAHFLGLHGNFNAIMPGGVRLEIKGMIAEGGRVAVEAESFGDSVVGLYHNRYHFLFELRDGLLTLGKEYADSAYMQAFSSRARAHQAQASDARN